MILVVLPESEVERIRDLAEREQVEIEVNLEKLMVIVTSSLGVESIPFSYDPFRRHCILEGLDDISYIMSAKSEIDSYRAAQEKVRFYSAKSPNRN